MGASAAPVLRLAFNELEPWKTRDAAGFGGAYTEIVRELARRTGHELAIVECPLKRCLKLLEAGEADLIIGLQQTPERARHLQFLAAPYRRASADKVFYVRAGTADRIARYEDLRGLTIAIKSGSEYFERFDADAQLRKDASPSHASNLRKLMLGRVDAVVMAEDQGQALLGPLALRGKVEPARYRVADPSPRSIALARASPRFAELPRLEQAMRELRADGTLARIYERHYYVRYGVDRRSLVVD